MDAALLVDLVDAQLHAVARLLAVAGQRAGQILDGAQRDLGLGNTLLGPRTACHHGQAKRHGREKDGCVSLHFCSPKGGHRCDRRCLL